MFTGIVEHVGRIEAVEALPISFGDGGLIDTGATSTAYADGDAYAMNAGEVLPAFGTIFSEAFVPLPSTGVAAPMTEPGRM